MVAFQNCPPNTGMNSSDRMVDHRRSRACERMAILLFLVGTGRTVMRTEQKSGHNIVDITCGLSHQADRKRLPPCGRMVGAVRKYADHVGAESAKCGRKEKKR
jgi:hypothetical protein